MSSGHYCDGCHQNYQKCECSITPLVERLEGSYTVQEQEAGERIRKLECALYCIKQYTEIYLDFNTVADNVYFMAAEGLKE
jgi:hypothetical protein